jgi:glutathione S-transferase
MTPELILHHFAMSPFAEKIRLILGCKGARWRSVPIPMVMPKPDVTALTGGYRRTPILQIGADIWCDTALIAKVLDQRLGGPSLYPGDVPLAPLLAQWADWTLFWNVIDFCSQPACMEHRFAHMGAEDRAAVTADRLAFRGSVPRQSAADAGANLRHYVGALDAQLGRGAEFVCGPLSVADFSVAQCLWHLRRGGPPADRLVEPYTRVLRWHDRMLALGHGNPEELSSAEAVRMCAQAGRHEPTVFESEDGLQRGQAVVVAASDYGIEPSAGTLVGLSDTEVVIERRDTRAGTVHVHFPRAGFRVSPAGG